LNSYLNLTTSKTKKGGHGFFCAIDLNEEIPRVAPLFPSLHIRGRHLSDAMKRKRRSFSNVDEEENKDSHSSESKNFTICLKYNLMMFMDYISDNEIVMIEQPWLDVIKSLPDAMERRVFGS